MHGWKTNNTGIRIFGSTKRGKNKAANKKWYAEPLMGSFIDMLMALLGYELGSQIFQFCLQMNSFKKVKQYSLLLFKGGTFISNSISLHWLFVPSSRMLSIIAYTEIKWPVTRIKERTKMTPAISNSMLASALFALNCLLGITTT